MNQFTSWKKPLFFSSALALWSTALTSCTDSTTTVSEADVLQLVPEIVAVHPFDESNFTQGIEVDGDSLIIGTGQYGGSRIFRTSIDGVEEHSEDLDDQYFGEGITRTDDIIWQLTWREGTAFKRDASTLALLETVNYDGEGWGLCAFDDRLIMSDGSAKLKFLDPASFSQIGEVEVTLNDEPATALNELECVDGEVYANVFQKTDILQINPDTGKVTAIVDASGLSNNAAIDPNNVLNGIAHIPNSDRFYLSGKRWPDLYEVKFRPAD